MKTIHTKYEVREITQIYPYTETRTGVVTTMQVLNQNSHPNKGYE